MSQALTVRGDRRDPAKASGRCRKAAEHYVKNSCRAIGPSLVWAGFSPHTAADPTRNGYTHDWLIEVARYWNKGSQVTARAFLSRAIGALGAMVEDPQVAPQARGAAAKTIIDVATREKDREDTAEVAAEEQAKWMNLIRHWKRTFLRRGILIGMDVGASEEKGYCCQTTAAGMGLKSHPNCRACRGERLLESLNWVLGKGPMPNWMGTEEDTDGEAVQRPEGGPQLEDYVEAEIVESETEPDSTEPGAGATDPE